MGGSDKLLAYGARYGDAGDAMKDFAEIKTMHLNDEVGDYDAAILTKEPSGTLMLTNGDSTGRFKSGFGGAVVGAVLGVVFPPTVLGMAALGAGAGAIAGRAKQHISRGDIKSLGDLLEPGESGIILVTDSVSDWAAGKLFAHAVSKKAIEVEGDSEAIVAAIRAAATSQGVDAAVEAAKAE